ncbi:Ubiquitin-like modifier-activating enzyme 1, partial [Araneus ventricosus]
VIVLTDSPLEEQCSIGEFAHSNDIAFIVADTKGLFGQVFCDFGENFTVHDVKGEQPLSAMVASISKLGGVAKKGVAMVTLSITNISSLSRMGAGKKGYGFTMTRGFLEI